MRYVEHNAGNAGAQGIEHAVKSLSIEIVDAIERGRSSQQAQMIGAFREQTVDEIDVDAVRGEHRVGNALRRILVEVQAGGVVTWAGARVGAGAVRIGAPRPSDGNGVRPVSGPPVGIGCGAGASGASGREATEAGACAGALDWVLRLPNTT
jgi:hypothetical protein